MKKRQILTLGLSVAMTTGMMAGVVSAPSFGIEFIYCAVLSPRDGLFAITSIFLCT